MKKIKLFDCCRIVMGYNRSIICDLQRNSYQFIPNSLYEILINYNGKNFNNLYNSLDDDDKLVFNEYIEFLVQNEYVFFTETPELFLDSESKFNKPSSITNSIIDSVENLTISLRLSKPITS